MFFITSAGMPTAGEAPVVDGAGVDATGRGGTIGATGSK